MVEYHTLRSPLGRTGILGSRDQKRDGVHEVVQTAEECNPSARYVAWFEDWCTELVAGIASQTGKRHFQNNYVFDSSGTDDVCEVGGEIT